MGATLRTSRPKLGPAWLTGGFTPDDNNESALVGYSLDLVGDAWLEAHRQGLLARFPQQDPNGTPAPADALAAMGRDRRVVRGINESAESFAERLTHAHTDRQTAGNAFTLAQKIAEYLGQDTVTVRTVDRRGNWFTRDDDNVRTYSLNTGNWNWDGAPASPGWSRFWVIVYPNGVFTAGPTWGAVGEVWGTTTGTWGSTASIDQVRTMQFLVADWKSQGRRCEHIILAFDANSFSPSAPEPNGTWLYDHTGAGAWVPSRLGTARYLDGRGI